MELVLEYPINVVVKRSDSEEKLKVVYRYPTKKEEKEFREIEKKLLGLMKRSRKLHSSLEAIEKKIEYAEKRGDWEAAEKHLNKKQKLEEEYEKLLEELEQEGGQDIGEVISKKKFEVLVGGEDKEKLQELAEIVGYTRIVSQLDKERGELEGKQ